jgi:SAM-dependent methyltransferase
VYWAVVAKPGTGCVLTLTFPDRRYRRDFLHAFRWYVDTQATAPHRILELGSGPGHLAERILFYRSDVERYVLFDSSDAMHHLAREELQPYAAVTEYITADLGSRDAFAKLGTFSVVVTLSAVLELRDKRQVKALYKRAFDVLERSGHFLVCIRSAADPSAANPDLFMTPGEQWASLAAAGFRSIEAILHSHGMSLYAARR